MVDPITGISPSRDSIWRPAHSPDSPCGPLSLAAQKPATTDIPASLIVRQDIPANPGESLLGRCLVGPLAGRGGSPNFRQVMKRLRGHPRTDTNVSTALSGSLAGAATSQIRSTPGIAATVRPDIESPYCGLAKTGHTYDYDQLALAEVKAHLSEELISRVREHNTNQRGVSSDRVIVTVHGHPSAVLLAPDDLHRLEETIAVLADHDLIAQLVSSESDLDGGRLESAEELGEGHDTAPDARVTARPYQPLITSTARRQLAERLPESIAFAAHEFISGPLLEKPSPRWQRADAAPARQAQRPTRHVSRAVSNQRRGHDSHRSGGGSIVRTSYRTD